jgi:hypothetical protein
MSVSMIAGLAGAGLNLAGGVGSYYASKANASIARAQGRIDNAVAKANATALELQGEYNAAVQRNNAIGAANQKKYENSVIKANRIALAQKFENQRERTLRTVRASGAEAVTRNPQLSKDVINSIEMEAFSQMSDENLEYTMAMQSMGAQMTENDRIAAVESMYGEMQAQNTLQGARNNAFFTRLSGQNAQMSANLRAGQMKLQAKSDLIGSLASSVSSSAQYFL